MNHWIDTTGTLDLWQVGVAYLLLAGSLTSLVMGSWDAGRQGSWPWWLVVGGAALLRLLVEGRIATVFIGYKATQQAIDLFPVPHYGAGVSVLYHQLLHLFGPDHRVIMTANAVMGSLTLPLVMAWVRRMTRSGRVALVVGVLVAIAPLFVRNDASDANNVPCLLWLFCGVGLLAQSIERGSRWPLWWAGFPLGLATVGRPELIVLVGGLVLVTAIAHPVRPPLRRLAWDALLLLPFVALTVPHFMHVLRAAEAMRQRGNIESLERMLGFRHNILLEPHLYGVGYTLAALAGTLLLWRTHRRWVLSLWAVVVVGMMVYSVDLDRANLARTLVPAALVATILAGHGLVRMAASVPRERLALGLAVAALAATNVPPALQLWAPTNERQEERLIRRALAAIDEPDFTLLRLNHPDPDPARASGAGHTHYHFPDYLVMTPERRGRVMPLSAWVDGPRRAPGPVYFLRSLRCYAEFRHEDQPPPAGANEHPLCRRLVDLPGAAPVFEAEIPNHGDVWINYYGDAETLTVGLYRLPTAGR